MPELFHQKVQTFELPFDVTIKHVKPLQTFVTREGKKIPVLRIYADDDQGRRCELRFYWDHGKQLAENETFKQGQRVSIQDWKAGSFRLKYPIVNVRAFEITKEADEYLLIMKDIGDAFFPNPREVEETYSSLDEARERIKAVTETHLKYTYTPLWLILPDGTKEDVYPTEDWE